MISGARIRQARELRILTQTELARHAGISQPAIAQIESGYIQPSTEVLKAIVGATRFPQSFFEQHPPIEFPVGTLAFRSRRSMSAKQEKSVVRWAQILAEVAYRLSIRLNVIPPRIPRLQERPETAAEITRASLGISPDTPIKNLVRSLESAGVLVILIPAAPKAVDAFSAWIGPTSELPMIAIAEDRPGDRQRLSLAHELGHLVLHNPPRDSRDKMEDEAFAFAAEFLLPMRAATVEISQPVTLSSLSSLKNKWGMSISSIIRRAREIGHISVGDYEYLNQQLSILGWKTAEPESSAVPFERPRALRKMIELLYADADLRIDLRAFASEMCLDEFVAKRLIDSYAPNPERHRSVPAIEPGGKITSFRESRG